MFKGYNLVITIFFIICCIILLSQLWYVPNLNTMLGRLVNTLYNISMSYFVSFIFYFMLVYLPEKKRKKSIQGFVKATLNSFTDLNDKFIKAIEEATKQKIDIMRMTEEEFQALFLNKIKLEEQAPFVNRVHFTKDLYEWDRFILANIEDAIELKRVLFPYMIYLEDSLIKILNNIINSDYYRDGRRILSLPNRESEHPKLIASYLFKYNELIEDLKYYYRDLK
jgi:hypothetical protein